jgi:hypothetical protein
MLRYNGGNNTRQFMHQLKYLAGVDSNIDGGPVGLLSLDPLNVDPQLGPVALHHLPHLQNLLMKTNNESQICKMKLSIYFQL